MKENVENFYQKENDDEINISTYLKFFLRKKNFIFPFTFIFTLIVILYSYTIKPVWKGRFHIYVNNKEGASEFSNLNSNSFTNLFKIGSNEKQTQEFILKSPSVLMPIFEQVKQNKMNKGEKVDNFNYNNWLKKKLQIYFEEGTNILTIAYLDTDKEFILKVLDNISTKYKDYSKRDREKNVSKTIFYLEEQKNIFKKKSNISLKKLNEFSVKHGLGNVDGFVQLGGSSTLEQIPISEIDLKSGMKPNNIFNKGVLREQDSGAGKTYRKQFAELERLEAEYVILSSKLKPNSITLKTLDNKIKNLKSSLKRPNEILLKYRDLKNIAKRDENTLIDLENNLQSVKLEKARQQDPWEMISKPTIDQGKIAPQRKRMAIISLISSFLLGTIIAFIKEKRSGIIFSLEDLKQSLICEYKETCYLNNKILNNKILNKLILEEENKSIGYIYINPLNSIASSKVNKFFDVSDKNFVSSIDEAEKKSFKKIILLIELGKLTYKEIKIINAYIKLNYKKYIGWIYLDYKI